MNRCLFLYYSPQSGISASWNECIMQLLIIMMYNTVSSVVIVLYSIYMQLLMRVSHIMICLLAFSYFTRNTNLGEISSHGNVKRMKYITVYDKYWHRVALAEKVKMILELS